MKILFTIFDFIDKAMTITFDFYIEHFEEEWPEWWPDGGGPPYIGA
jgi:hypothetical protein